MEREVYIALVQKLEQQARQEPVRYQRRVGLLAALGYLYIFFVLGVVLALIAGLVWIVLNLHRFNAGFLKIGLLLCVFAYGIVRSLWVKFPKPEGVELTRDQAPQLFAMLDDLQSRLQTTRFHHVLLDADFNAAVAQVPKLGMLGWQTNYLLLGLPLMQALPPEQFRAVVAHELGHLSGNHSRFGGYIYRLYRVWDQLWENFQHNNGGALIFDKFLRWYAPLFGAYSFALRRANEYVADRCAAEMSGVETAGDALVRVEIQARYLGEEFWPQVYRQAEQQNAPPADVFTRLNQALKTQRAPAEEALVYALRSKTDYDDTHPCLSDRLSALGYLAQNSEETAVHKVRNSSANTAFGKDAAQFYLASSLENLTAQLQKSWQENMSEQWQERHESVQKGQGRLQELEAKAADESLNEEEMWERAHLTANCRDAQSALPIVQNLLALYPEHAGGQFLCGQLLLEQKDETGIAHLERAMQISDGLTVEACGEIYGFLKNLGRDEEARVYRERAEKFQEKLIAAHEERADLSKRAVYLPHELPAATVEALRQQLMRHHQIGESFLVRKQVEHFPEEPCYILGITTRQTVAKFFSTEDKQKQLNEIMEGLEVPDGTMIVMFGDNTKHVEKALKKIEGAKIYSHKDAKSNPPQ